MKGSRIRIAGYERGVQKEGIISGTPKPGTCMEVKATAIVQGHATWQAFQTQADGKPNIVAVLTEGDLEGSIYSTAYANGDWGFLYCPVAGEEINVIVLDISGTGDDISVGELFMIDNPTGKLIANSSGSSVPFISMEAVTDPTADTLTWCMYTGH